jgi:hypothetical protein
MTTFLLVMAYSALGLWLLFALARVQAAWTMGERRAGELRSGVTAAGLKLLADQEAVKKIEDHIKRVNEAAAQAERDQQDRHAALVKSTPAPPEIHVTSEYPAARHDTPWVVRFVRSARFPRQQWEREPQTCLVWAAGQPAAFLRAQKLAEEYKTYGVSGVSPLL